MSHDKEFERHAIRIAELALERKRAWRDLAAARNVIAMTQDAVDKQRTEISAAMSDVALWEERMNTAIDALEQYVKGQEAISAT